MKRLLLVVALVLVFCFSKAQRYGVVINSCSFKESCVLLKNFSDTGLWQIGTPSKSFFYQAGNGVGGLVTDSINNYAPNKNEYFDVRFKNNDLNIRLSFWHRFDTDSLADGGYIEASYDNGITWQDIHQYDTNNLPIFINTVGFYDESSALGNGKPGFSGKSKDTVLSIIEWVWNIPLKMAPDSIWLRFHFYSDSIDNGKEGWMIDRMETSYDEVWGGLDKSQNASRVKIYPNPGKGLYTLELLTVSNDSYELAVFDFQGKRLLRGSVDGQNPSSLDLTGFPDGMYFYILTENGTVVNSGKLIKE